MWMKNVKSSVCTIGKIVYKKTTKFKKMEKKLSTSKNVEKRTKTKLSTELSTLSTKMK